MMTGIPVNLTLRDLVSSYLRRQEPIPWLDWLPLAEIAADTPERLAAAFNELALKQQFDLVGLLRMPDAGPLADAIVIALARYAAEIQDDQVRQFILEDASQSRAHQASVLEKIREQLAAQVTAARNRLQADFDLAQEIVRLEQELAEIRQREYDQDERFARVHELEHEILTLEVRRRKLAEYDEAKRRHYLEALQAEVEALQQRKTALEEAIAAAIGEREKRLKEVQGRESELQTKQSELRDAQSRLDALEQQVRETEDRLRETRDQQANLQNRLQEIQVQSGQMEQSNRKKKDEVIARDAALIANGIVSVQKRLLNDVGLIAHISAPLAGKLGLSPQEQQVLIIPILPRGTPLPAVFKSTDLGLPTTIAAGEKLALELVVDDDSEDPWVQCWTLSHPGGGQEQPVKWEMRADRDGALTLRLQPVRGRPAEVVGRLERTRVGRAHLIVGEVLGRGTGALPRVTPQQLRQAFEQLKHSS